jgi:hypothetical protein
MRSSYSKAVYSMLCRVDHKECVDSSKMVFGFVCLGPILSVSRWCETV